jgi:hypothetical protein
MRNSLRAIRVSKVAWGHAVDRVEREQEADGVGARGGRSVDRRAVWSVVAVTISGPRATMEVPDVSRIWLPISWRVFEVVQLPVLPPTGPVLPPVPNAPPVLWAASCARASSRP